MHDVPLDHSQLYLHLYHTHAAYTRRVLDSRGFVSVRERREGTNSRLASPTEPLHSQCPRLSRPEGGLTSAILFSRSPFSRPVLSIPSIFASPSSLSLSTLFHPLAASIPSSLSHFDGSRFLRRRFSFLITRLIPPPRPPPPMNLCESRA